MQCPNHKTGKLTLLRVDPPLEMEVRIIEERAQEVRIPLVYKSPLNHPPPPSPATLANQIMARSKGLVKEKKKQRRFSNINQPNLPADREMMENPLRRPV